MGGGVLLGSVHSQLSVRVDWLALLDRLWIISGSCGSGCRWGVLGGFMGLRRLFGGLGGACCSGSEELLLGGGAPVPVPWRFASWEAR